MKQIIYLLILIVSVLACKKNTPVPTPVPTPTGGMTATETALVGIWYWDSTEFYLGGVKSLGNTWTPKRDDQYDSGYADFRTTKSPANLPGLTWTIYDLIFRIGTRHPPSMLGQWSVKTFVTNANGQPLLEAEFLPGPLGGRCFIVVLTSNKLVTEDWSGNIAQGYKCYYHK